MWKKFDKLFFQGPNGLGDYFVINGIVNYFADRCVELHLPISNNYEDTLSLLYSIHPNIITVPFPPTDETYAIEDKYCKEHKCSRINRTPIMWARDGAGNGVSPIWDQQLYSYFQLPFFMRYSNFRMPENIPESKLLYNELIKDKTKPYALYHFGFSQDPKANPIDIKTLRCNSLNLPDIPLIDVSNITHNMLYLTDLILHASEIHCIPSSFFCFVDSIHNKTSAALYYYNIRKQTLLTPSTQWNNFRWACLEFESKLL
jgi:hypothetical protein